MTEKSSVKNKRLFWDSKISQKSIFDKSDLPRPYIKKSTINIRNQQQLQQSSKNKSKPAPPPPWANAVKL